MAAPVIGVWSKNLADIKQEWLEGGAVAKDKEVRMPANIRVERAAGAVNVLPYLAGGVKQTGHLTDDTPKFIVLLILDGVYHILMNVVNEWEGQVYINLEALAEVPTDYSRELRSPVYIGRRKGFMYGIDGDLRAFEKSFKGAEIHYGTINSVAEKSVP